MQDIPLNQILPLVINIARRAGEEIMSYYKGSIEVENKQDNSPLTQADLASHHFITRSLATLNPEYPILSEESADEIPFEIRKHWQTFWIVDPLDGTKEFIHKRDEFTVNIALIHNNRPILGVIFAPALNEMYYAAESLGAFKQINHQKPKTISVRQKSEIETLKVAGSLRHGREELEAFLAKRNEEYDLQSFGSALKFCKVAEGVVDLYPRLTPVMEWDSAAGQCIVEQAGGVVTNISESPLTYNKEPSSKVPSFICSA